MSEEERPTWTGLSEPETKFDETQKPVEEQQEENLTQAVGGAVNRLITNLSKDLFEMTREEAWASNICINCKESIEGKIYSKAGWAEYKISGMCEHCYDELFKDDVSER